MVQHLVQIPDQLIMVEHQLLELLQEAILGQQIGIQEGLMEALIIQDLTIALEAMVIQGLTVLEITVAAEVLDQGLIGLRQVTLQEVDLAVCQQVEADLAVCRLVEAEVLEDLEAEYLQVADLEAVAGLDLPLEVQDHQVVQEGVINSQKTL